MLETFLTGTLFVVGTIFLVCSGYLTMRSFAAKSEIDDTKELAGSVIFRVSALHGLILALVFAQQMAEYRELQSEVVREATSVADIYFDIKRHGSGEAVAVQSALSRYVDLVLSEEWQSLGNGAGLTAQPWKEWETVYQILLDLKISTPRKESLRNHMLIDIRKIAESRDQRANHGLKTIGTMFWFAAISGVLLISVTYHCFKPTLHHLFLISIFAAYTGVVMFFIYSFSNPFSPPGALSPHPFQKLQASKTFK